VIVADTNLVAYALIEGERTGLARTLYAHDADWRLPSLWRHEFLNVLATCARQGIASAAQVRALWTRALDRFGPGEAPVDAQAALSLASAHPVSAYDAQFLVLAESLHAPLVTEDRRLQRAFPALACSIRSYLERGS